jgi:hypothetical protein
VSFDVTALAQSGASILVTAMTTELWTQVRGRVGRLFGRQDAVAEQQALAELDEMRTSIDEAPDADTARDAAVELRGSLKTRLRNDPELAAAFAELVAELREQLAGTAPPAAVQQTARADRGSQVFQAGRDILGNPGRPGR